MKTPCDKLIYGGILLTMNDEFSAYADGALAIQGDTIVAIGESAAILAIYDAPQKINCEGQIILPGLVNAHTHMPMTLLRGMADDLRLEVWLMGYVMPTEKQFVTPEFCRLGTLLSAAEMIRSGTTLFADMYYFEKEVAAATAEAGIRGVCGQTVMMFPTPDSDSWEKTLAYIEEFAAEYRDHPLIVPAIAPHAPYTCTDEILQRCAELARQLDIPLHIHIAETRFEVDRSLEEEGMTVLKRAEKTSVLDTKCICAHCVHLDGEEIKLAAHKGVGISHNPSSNLKLASGLAPVMEMLSEGVKLGIGTDGAASNNDLDMMQEIHLASLVAKLQTGDPTALPARQALLMATRLGAEALHMGHLTGSLEVGKRADLIVLNDGELHTTPRFQHDINAVYGRVVYAAKSSDIQHVMCNGVWLMQNRELLTLDEKQIRQDAQTLAHEIDLFVRNLAEDTFNKLVAIGGVKQTQSFELQAKMRFGDVERLMQLFSREEIEVLRYRLYRQYDTYFVFESERLRYREEEQRNEADELLEMRTRLTYTSHTKERIFGETTMLSHSRFIAPAHYPLRFYREYFKAPKECQVEKKRRRWRFLYKGVEFFVNFDELDSSQTFLEVKTRTWSAQDAENKAKLVQELLAMLQIPISEMVYQDYVELALERS